MILKPKELDRLSLRYDSSKIGFDFSTFNGYFSSYFSLKSSFFKNFFHLLSSFGNSTNSPYIFFDFQNKRYKVQKLSFPMGSAFIVYSNYLGQEHPYFCWYEYNPEDRGALKYDFQILLYGTFFRLNEIDSNPHYEEIINDLFESGFSISRIDIKNDLFAKEYIPSLVSPFKVLNISHNAPLFLNNVGDNITSWRYGEKKNGRKVIRFYNKFLDIKRVGNQSLYTSAYNYGTFHRLEIQYMYKEVKHIKNMYAFNDFLDKQRLFNLSAPINIDKIEYLKTNPTQFELQNKLTSIFSDAVKIKLPIAEIVFYSLLESGFTDFKRLKNLIQSSSCV